MRRDGVVSCLLYWRYFNGLWGMSMSCLFQSTPISGLEMSFQEPNQEIKANITANLQGRTYSVTFEPQDGRILQVSRSSNPFFPTTNVTRQHPTLTAAQSENSELQTQNTLIISLLKLRSLGNSTVASSYSRRFSDVKRVNNTVEQREQMETLLSEVNGRIKQIENQLKTHRRLLEQFDSVLKELKMKASITIPHVVSKYAEKNNWVHSSQPKDTKAIETLLADMRSTRDGIIIFKRTKSNILAVANDIKTTIAYGYTDPFLKELKQIEAHLKIYYEHADLTQKCFQEIERLKEDMLSDPKVKAARTKAFTEHVNSLPAVSDNLKGLLLEEAQGAISDTDADNSNDASIPKFVCCPVMLYELDQQSAVELNVSGRWKLLSRDAVIGLMSKGQTPALGVNPYDRTLLTTQSVRAVTQDVPKS